MKSLQSICIEEQIAIGDAIRKLDATGCRILLVTKQGKMTGVVTDVDVRKWILKKGSFETNVSALMCKTPKFVYEGDTDNAKEIMVSARVDALPVLNKLNEPVDLIFLRDLVDNLADNYEKIDIPVVVMAGGKGTRLKPYTDILPKPLIPMGSRTILERIIDSFRKNGCNFFYLTLNYKKNLIKAYFDDKENDFTIEYIEEEDFYGTCGSLSMLRDKIHGTFFLSNCDVLLEIDYAKLYDFHVRNQNEITAVTSLKHFQIPYGIFEIEEGGKICKLLEKPEYNYHVNAGIYVMEASVLNDIPQGKAYQMTDLICKLLEEKRKVGAYPITENLWKDMGEPDEMQKMRRCF